MDHIGIGKAFFHGVFAPFVHAEEISHVDGHADVFPIHGFQQGDDPVGAVDEKAVVFKRGGHTVGGSVIRQLPDAFYHQGELFHEVLRGVGGHGTAEGGHIVAHFGEPQTVGYVNVGLHPLDLRTALL